MLNEQIWNCVIQFSRTIHFFTISINYNLFIIYQLFYLFTRSQRFNHMDTVFFIPCEIPYTRSTVAQRNTSCFTFKIVLVYFSNETLVYTKLPSNGYVVIKAPQHVYSDIDLTSYTLYISVNAVEKVLSPAGSSGAEASLLWSLSARSLKTSE